MQQALSGVVEDGTGSLLATVQDITLAEAEYGLFPLTVVHADGTPFDLTGYELVMAARATDDVRFPRLLFARLSEASDEPNGLVVFKVGASDTKRKHGTYFYDVYATEVATDKKYRIVRGSAFIVEDAAYDPDDVATPVDPAQFVVGMPAPAPTYKARAVWNGSAPVWQQFDVVDTVFDGVVGNQTVTFADFGARPKSIVPLLESPTDIVGLYLLNETATSVDVYQTAPSACTVRLLIDEVIS